MLNGLGLTSALAVENRTPDIYHVHHGSLSAALRETAENAMRDAERQTCIAATVTLELGIDIGRLDLGSPTQCYPLGLQLCPTSRPLAMGAPSRMFFYSRETKPDSARSCVSHPLEFAPDYRHYPTLP